MKNQSKKWFALILVLALSLMMFAGCSKAPETGSEPETDVTEATDTEDTVDTTEEKGTVKLVYVNWAEGVAMTNLAKVILEDKMGYNVEITMADVAPIFTALANNDQDAFMDSWLPVTHGSYIEEYGDDLEDLGINYKDAKLGLVVPSYMPIDSIADLNTVKDELDGQITGIDSGAGVMAQTETAITEYDLDLELLPGSGPAMTAALGAAIDENESIVVTGWAPHWMFARWDLKILEDPKLIFGDSENIHTMARKGLSTDMPEVAEFLTNFTVNDQQLGSLMGAIADSDEDPDAVARTWMAENEELVNSWLPAE